MAGDEIADLKRQRDEAAIALFAEKSLAERAIAIEATKEYGAATIKSLILLNGGAIIALLALLSALYSKDAGAALIAAKVLTVRLSKALAWFAGGLGLAAITSAVGYLNWFNVAATYGTPSDVADWMRGEKAIATERWRERAINATIGLACLSALTSLACFGWGAWTVFRAFRRLI